MMQPIKQGKKNDSAKRQTLRGTGPIKIAKVKKTISRAAGKGKK